MELFNLKPGLLDLKAACLLFLIIAILFCLSTTTADPDLWGYLAFGRLFWSQAQFPYQDVFAYVPTLKPWIYHEWLTGVVFYPLYQNLGAPGLQVLKNGLGLATMGATYLTARRRGADFLPTILTLCFTLLCLAVGYSAVRAQVFTYFCFALFLYLLETARLSGDWSKLWVLAPLQMIWCNLHGGFLAGLGLVLLYAVGEALSRRPFWPYLGWFLPAGLATLINPYGLQYWSYLVRAVTMPRPEISEWASLFEGYKKGFWGEQELFFYLNFMTVAVLLAWLTRWREITPALVLLVILALAFKHHRHQIFFALAFGAYMPLLLTAYFRDLSTRPAVMTGIRRLGLKIPAMAMLLLMGFLVYRIVTNYPLKLEVPTGADPIHKNRPYYPVGAVDYIEQQRLVGKLLVHFNWGEYCLWRLYPRCLVAIDGRYETVYPEKVHREYFDFLMGREGWRSFLDQYPPDLILIGIQSRVYGLLGRDSQWLQIYTDPSCALFRRQTQPPPEPAPPGSRFGGGGSHGMAAAGRM